MKFIHCADVHLGSKIEAKLPPEKTEERKAEVRAAFKKTIERAREEGIKVMVLAGDVFDGDRPFKKDKEFFYGAVRNNPDVDFLYLRGNHDVAECVEMSELPNLKTFGKEWTSYSYGDVEFWGIELCPENSVSFYSTLRLDESKKNVVIAHGQKSDSVGDGKINLARLRNKNIDYLALGHVHSFSVGALDERGVYAYSGCLEGRGFDETGEKGFVVVDIGSSDLPTVEFVANSIRKITVAEVDLSGATSVYEAYKKVSSSLAASRRDLIEVVLTGEVDFDSDGLSDEVKRLLGDEFYFVEVKDRTTRKIDMQKVVGDSSLKGEFVRRVLASDESDENKSKIISIGLKALSGGEIE